VSSWSGEGTDAPVASAVSKVFFIASFVGRKTVARRRRFPNTESWVVGEDAGARGEFGFVETANAGDLLRGSCAYQAGFFDGCAEDAEPRVRRDQIHGWVAARGDHGRDRGHVLAGNPGAVVFGVSIVSIVCIVSIVSIICIGVVPPVRHVVRLLIGRPVGQHRRLQDAFCDAFSDTVCDTTFYDDTLPVGRVRDSEGPPGCQQKRDQCMQIQFAHVCSLSWYACAEYIN
jgi:hypothetical protein